MAYRDFDSISRRALLRGGAMLGAGAGLLAWPATSVLARQTAQWSHVAEFVNGYVTSRRVANMVATLGWGQQPATTIARGMLALGGRTEAGPDSLYRIYSMTKPVTGMAAMMLIDEGKLGLDQPLGEVLPAFREMQVQRTYDGLLTDVVPAERPITIRHLLTHTAGFGYSIVQRGPISRAYQDAGLIPGQVTKLPLAELFGRGQPVRGLDRFADALANLPLVAQPGTRWSYSVSLDLLGRVIEVASGQEFAEFLEDRFFEPLGMRSTYFRVPERDLHRLTTNYGVVAGTLVPVDPPELSVYADEPAFPFGGAGLVSSPADYDRFLQMLASGGVFEGRRIMGAEAVRVGTSNLLPEGVSTAGTFADGSGFGAGGRVGLGAQAGTFGWGGAAGTIGFVNVANGLRASLMTQYMPAEAYPVQTGFPAAVLKDLAAMPAAA